VLNSVTGLSPGLWSYADYTQQFNDFLRRSPQPLTDDFQCVRFNFGLANLKLQTDAKSHRLQQKVYNMMLMELHIFLSDLMIDSPRLGRARTAPASAHIHRGNRPNKKRPLDNLDDEGSKRL
jgi:hypothetical protein